jgi:hypothetical protein
MSQWYEWVAEMIETSSLDISLIYGSRRWIEIGRLYIDVVTPRAKRLSF